MTVFSAEYCAVVRPGSWRSTVLGQATSSRVSVRASLLNRMLRKAGFEMLFLISINSVLSGTIGPWTSKTSC